MASQQEKEGELRQKRVLAVEQGKELQSAHAALTRDINQLGIDISNDESHLRALSGGADAQLARFGREIPGILRDISQSRFQGVVKGPLGSYVKIRDGYEHLGPVLEQAIGRSLSAFLVTCPQDRAVLSSILRRHGCDSSLTIYIQRSAPRYASDKIPTTAGIETVLDALIIDEDDVFNCLVDHAHLESTTAAESEEDCSRRLVDRTGGRARFRGHIRTCITMEGTKLNYFNGNQASEFNRIEYKRLLAKDQESAKQAYLEKIEAKKEQLAHLRAQHRELQQQGGSNGKATLDSLDAALRSCSDSIRKATRRKQELESELNEIAANSNIDTSTMEAEAEELKAAIDVIVRQIEDLTCNLEVMKSNLAQKMSARDAIARRKEVLVNTARDEQRRLENFIDQQVNLQRKVEKHRKFMEAQESDISKIQQLASEQQSLYEEALQLATDSTTELIPGWDGQPISMGGRETVMTVTAKIKAMQDQLKTERAKKGVGKKTLEEANFRYQRAREDADRSKDLLDKLSTGRRSLQQDYDIRATAWRNSRKKCSRLVSKRFDEYMRDKNFSGKITFNHDAETLLLTCSTDNSDDNSSCKDVRQLSGGERSYTTLCLLLALGHVVSINDLFSLMIFAPIVVSVCFFKFCCRFCLPHLFLFLFYF